MLGYVPTSRKRSSYEIKLESWCQVYVPTSRKRINMEKIICSTTTWWRCLTRDHNNLSSIILENPIHIMRIDWKNKCWWCHLVDEKSWRENEWRYGFDDQNEKVKILMMLDEKLYYMETWWRLRKTRLRWTMQGWRASKWLGTEGPNALAKSEWSLNQWTMWNYGWSASIIG